MDFRRIAIVMLGAVTVGAILVVALLVRTNGPKTVLMPAAPSDPSFATYPIPVSEQKPWVDEDDAFQGWSCDNEAAPEIPVKDQPSASERQLLKGCSSEALYFGIKVPRDPVKARKCAIIEAEDGKIRAYEGYGMLTMIYGNGVGVPRDVDLGLRLLCASEPPSYPTTWLPVGRTAAKRSGRRAEYYDFCDGTASSADAYLCELHEAKIRRPKREARFAKLTADWSRADLTKLDRVREAHEAYIKSCYENENYQSGLLGPAEEENFSEKQRQHFVELLQTAEGGMIPTFSRSRLNGTEGRLEAKYAAIFHNTDLIDDLPNKKAGLLAGRRAWLRYRDAFLDLASSRYPRVDRNSVTGWLTKERIDLLEKVGDYVTPMTDVDAPQS